jgi:hypothetical protein
MKTKGFRSKVAAWVFYLCTRHAGLKEISYLG